MLGKKLIEAATGANAAGESIEDLFSTWLYTGNGSTQTITNGIDLAGKGGMVWMKSRNAATNYRINDTNRGTTFPWPGLTTNSTGAATSDADGVYTFDSTGFSLASGSAVNSPGATYASWTFRKAPGFFDVATYTGDGVSGRQIAHSLGSAPGCIVVKATNIAYNWAVYHRSLGPGSRLYLNTLDGAFNSNLWVTTPSASTFTVSDSSVVNQPGITYVAYLFAHDKQIFGEGGDQSVIKCGSFLSQSGSVATVELGWEPQWVLVKSGTGESSWRIIDNMRGWTLGNDAQLVAEQASAEVAGLDLGHPTSTGFYSRGSVLAGETGIYIAIRRGPMKTPTSGTEVFNTVAATSNAPWWKPGFVVDWGIGFSKTQADKCFTGTRLLGTDNLNTTQTAAAWTNSLHKFDYQNGWFGNTSASSDYMSWSFRRAPGFFDVVAYTGTGVTRTVAHNLSVAPELMIVKARSNAYQWAVYSKTIGAANYLVLNMTSQASASPFFWNNTDPTDTVFSVGTEGATNNAAWTYIAYLFATLPGISKVFSFTGNGTSQTIDCGFAAGARFVLLKRTDSAGNWLVADTARGIVSGNDPLLYLNSTAAEITTLDWIDPHSSGFIVNQEATANANVGGATYIGLAIA